MVELRNFGGLNIEETAAALEISPATVQREWRIAKAWLRGGRGQRRMCALQLLRADNTKKGAL
jgi:DNA-directed RNA polymerase specialized sigma24 family protein